MTEEKKTRNPIVAFLLLWWYVTLIVVLSAGVLFGVACIAHIGWWAMEEGWNFWSP